MVMIMVWLLGWGQGAMPVDPLKQQQELLALITNQTLPAEPGQDTVVTQAWFEGEEPERTLVVTETYIDPETGKVGMRETRHIPLQSVQKIALHPSASDGNTTTRFMVVVHYQPDHNVRESYVSHRLAEDAGASLVLTWPLRWYSQEIALQILERLGQFCQESPSPTLK